MTDPKAARETTMSSTHCPTCGQLAWPDGSEPPSRVEVLEKRCAELEASVDRYKGMNEDNARVFIEQGKRIAELKAALRDAVRLADNRRHRPAYGADPLFDWADCDARKALSDD